MLRLSLRPTFALLRLRLRQCRATTGNADGRHFQRGGREMGIQAGKRRLETHSGSGGRLARAGLRLRCGNVSRRCADAEVQSRANRSISVCGGQLWRRCVGRQKRCDSLTEVAAHIDGWVPFTANVTPYAVSGGTLYAQVEVKGRKKFLHNGKYLVPEGATWYDGLEEGILRGISLQILPPVHIENVFVQPQTAPDTLQAQADVTNDSDVPQSSAVGRKTAFREPTRNALP